MVYLHSFMGRPFIFILFNPVLVSNGFTRKLADGPSCELFFSWRAQPPASTTEVWTVISGTVLLWCEENVSAAEFCLSAEPYKPMLARSRAGQPITAGTVIVMESLWASSVRSHPKITLGSISSEEMKAFRAVACLECEILCEIVGPAPAL